MMKPEHVIQFCDYKLQQYQPKRDKAYADYLAYVAKIEARWYYKLFNQKFVPSIWDEKYLAFTRFDWYIEIITDLKKVAIYKDKMQYQTMIIKDNTYNQQFYRWADINNIPY